MIRIFRQQKILINNAQGPGGSEQTGRLKNYPFDTCYLVADGGFGCYPDGIQV